MLRPEALIVGYAMSRLDTELLHELGYLTWNAAFADVGSRLKVAPKSVKALRDEFDVFFPNPRRGWLNREPLPSRVKVLHEFEAVSGAALVEIVQRILAGDRRAVGDVLSVVAEPPPVRIANVAERLRTGRLAEAFFMRHSREIVDVASDRLRDMRNDACGCDFGVMPELRVGIEVKGLKEASGQILFTDREWAEATTRREDYWLVVVAKIQSGEPEPKIITDPASKLKVRCQIIQSRSVCWSATVVS
jgi:hypothetical protein